MIIVRVRLPQAIIPARFGIITGEVLYQLRSALDHLIWKLVEVNGHTPGKGNAFPILKAPPKTANERSRFRRMVKGVSTRAKTRIKQVQPYHFSAGYQSSPIWNVGLLNNIDKHRFLLGLFATRFGAEVFREGRFLAGYRGPAPQDSAELFRFLGTPADLEVDMDIQTHAAIVLDQISDAKSQAIVPLLTELRDATWDIIELFRSEFS